MHDAALIAQIHDGPAAVHREIPASECPTGPAIVAGYADSPPPRPCLAAHAGRS